MAHSTSISSPCTTVSLSLSPSLPLFVPSFLPIGCAFVTYHNRHSAIEAQKALHEKKTLPGVSKKEKNVLPITATSFINTPSLSATFPRLCYFPYTSNLLHVAFSVFVLMYDNRRGLMDIVGCTSFENVHVAMYLHYRAIHIVFTFTYVV